MRVLFLNPPFHKRISRANRGPAVGRGGTLYYPYWLAYAAAVLEKLDFEVKLIDAIARGMTLDEVAHLIEDFKPELTVMDIAAPSFVQDFETAEKIKSANCGVLVAVGPHATAQAKEILTANRSFDAVARREYDYTIRDMAVSIRNENDWKQVDGITHRNGQCLTDNPDRAYIENLDELPFVSEVYKRHLNIEDYYYAANLKPEVTILSGRGCPSRCYWCMYPQLMTGHKFRARSKENFVAELEYIKKEMPEVREVFIEDDTFTADQKRVEEICRLILKKKLRVKWSCNARPNVKLETMKLMKKAGCRMILVGFESGSQAVLNGMRKGTKVERNREFMNDARKSGLIVHACFTAGGTNETAETLQQTLDFAIELKPTTAQFCPIMVYPGTEAYEWAKTNGYLNSTDFTQWITPEGTHNCQVTTEELSAEQITEFCNYARRQFYLRPRYIIRTALWAAVRPVEWPRMWKSFLNLSRFIFRFGKKKVV